MLSIRTNFLINKMFFLYDILEAILFLQTVYEVFGEQNLKKKVFHQFVYTSTQLSNSLCHLLEFFVIYVPTDE